MVAYFQSLQRVIDLDPGFIIPSHGMAMGGTYRLRATLEHRRRREAQVLAAHREGKDRHQMLPLIYPDLDSRLTTLALCNIDAHLAKLASEQQL